MENSGLDLLIQHGDKLTGFVVLIALVFFYAKGLLPRLSDQAKKIDDLDDTLKMLVKSMDQYKVQSSNTEKQMIEFNTYIKYRMQTQLKDGRGQYEPVRSRQEQK